MSAFFIKNSFVPVGAKQEVQYIIDCEYFDYYKQRNVMETNYQTKCNKTL